MSLRDTLVIEDPVEIWAVDDCGFGIGASVEARYFVDLFAGSGGLSLGLEEAGFKPILVNEINASAMETYLMNRDERYPWLRERFNVASSTALASPDCELLRGFLNGFKEEFGIDVANGELDLVVGGPPCQGFSRIGHRRSYAAPRRDVPSNLLFLDMVALIQVMRPRLFLFENVVGLTTAKWSADGVQGEVWAEVLRAFESIKGYEVGSSVVHAKDYGVPQNRPRVLIVGMREDLVRPSGQDGIAGGLLPKGRAVPPNLVDLLGDLVDDNYENGGETTCYPREPLTDIQVQMRTQPAASRVSQVGEPLTEQKYSRHSQKVIDKFSTMIFSGGTIDPAHRTKKFSQRLLPRVWDDRGPYITVTSLPDDYVHFSQPRTPTVREWARMQTFPDWYQFAGPRTTGGILRAGRPQDGILTREVPKYTQIGNAVPVVMAREIGRHFMRLLDDQDMNR
jgi:DNA (cytosine-5)-methyltransferase 1